LSTIKKNFYLGTEMFDIKAVGKRIREVRKRLNKTQDNFKNEIAGKYPNHGIERSYIGNIETGKVDKINFVVICFIVDEYGVSIDWLLRGEGEMLTPNSDSRPSKEDFGISVIATMLNHMRTKDNKEFLLTELDKLNRSIEIGTSEKDESKGMYHEKKIRNIG